MLRLAHLNFLGASSCWPQDVDETDQSVTLTKVGEVAHRLAPFTQHGVDARDVQLKKKQMQEEVIKTFRWNKMPDQ